MSNWTVTKAEDHWFEVRHKDGRDAFVKWDGCTQLQQEPDGDFEIHIDELEDFIKDLQDLLELAKKHYGNSFDF